MEQKRIVIDQGSRCSLLIPSFEPIRTAPWVDVVKEAREGREQKRIREMESERKRTKSG